MTTTTTTWEYDDGGRAAAGFGGVHDAGDCVARSIAIATEIPYRTVYRELADGARRLGLPASARDGVKRAVYDRLLADLGWAWTPAMTIGAGCRVHLDRDELPSGRLVVRVSKHVTAVVDGVVHDNHDPTRDGSRCVYGYWSEWTDPPREHPVVTLRLGPA